MMWKPISGLGGCGQRLKRRTELLINVSEGAVVEHCVGRQADIGADARVGPYAVLEPGCRVAPGTLTGPFFRGGGDEHGG